MENFSAQEKLVDQYIQQGKKGSAIQLLFELIVVSVKEKNFLKAEALRKKLMEIDSMALNEIIKSAEIIEEAKRESLDESHMATWANLYETLNTEEGNALYYAMKEATYGVEETIFKENDKNACLYFIDQGKLKLVYQQDKKENLLKILTKGQTAGEDTFFSITFCTTSLVTISSVKLKVLNRDVLEDWKEEFPWLEQKIHDFCLGQEQVNELLKKKGQDRRLSKRIEVSGNVMAQLHNSAGEPVAKAFKGVVADISEGGLSFAVRIPKTEVARLLLGRGLIMKIILSDGKLQRIVNQRGLITSVSHHLISNYLIHVRFGQNLSERTMMEIAGLSSPEE